MAGVMLKITIYFCELSGLLWIYSRCEIVFRLCFVLFLLCAMSKLKSLFSKSVFTKSVLSKRKSGLATTPELAVVLTVLGLLVAAFPTYSKLIAVARANSVIRDVSQITGAVYSFQAAYGFLPGDYNSAASGSMLSTGVSLGNGNGDGYISWGGAFTSVTSNASNNESLDAFQHLYANGSLSNITYTPCSPALGLCTGIVAGTSASTLTTKNVYRSNIDSGAFAMTSYSTAASVDVLVGKYAHDNVTAGAGTSITLVFGKIGTTAITAANSGGSGGAGFVASTGSFIDSGAVDTNIAAAIDKKIDDSIATTGDLKYDSAGAAPVLGFKMDVRHA